MLIYFQFCKIKRFPTHLRTYRLDTLCKCHKDLKFRYYANLSNSKPLSYVHCVYIFSKLGESILGFVHEFYTVPIDGMMCTRLQNCTNTVIGKHGNTNSQSCGCCYRLMALSPQVHISN